MSDAGPSPTRRPLLGLGIAQLAIGLLSLATGIAIGSLYDEFDETGHVFEYTGGIEIWTELFFIAAGFSAIFAWKKQTTSSVVAHMILCITAAVNAGILVITASLYAHPRVMGYFSVLHLVLAVLGGIELVFAVVSAALSCRWVCCGRKQPPVAVVLTNVATGEQQQPPMQVVFTVMPPNGNGVTQ